MFEQGESWVKNQVCIALAILDEEQQEWLLIGSLKEIQKRLCGNTHAVLLHESIRPMGAFLNDFNDEAMDLIDVMIALNELFEWKNGNLKKKREMKRLDGFDGYETEANVRETLENIWIGDNSVKKFVALRIWREYSLLLDIKTQKNFVDIRSQEFYEYCARYIYPFRMGEKWEVHINEPLKGNLAMYRKTKHEPENDMRVVVMYPSDENKYEYACTDYSLLGLKAYYRQKLMLNRWIVAECKICKKVFLAKTLRKGVCSEACEKVNAKVKRSIRRSDADKLEFERLFNRENKYWRDKLRKVEGDETLFHELKHMHEEFKKREQECRAAVIQEEKTIKELFSWYNEQRALLNVFLDKNDIK